MGFPGSGFFIWGRAKIFLTMGISAGKTFMGYDRVEQCHSAQRVLVSQL